MVRILGFSAAAWVQSLVGELRSHKHLCVAKNNNKKKIQVSTDSEPISVLNWVIEKNGENSDTVLSYVIDFGAYL